MAVLMKRKVMECMLKLVTKDPDVSQLNEATDNGPCRFCHHDYDNRLKLGVLAKIKSFEDATKRLDIEHVILTHQIRVLECGCQGNVVLSEQCSCTNDVTWLFVRLCLKSLLALSTLCREAEGGSGRVDKLNDPSQANFLGVQDEKILCSVMEFITGLGINPNLMPGVGLPLESESNVLTSSKLKTGKVNFRRLYMIVYTMMDILKAKQMYFVLFPKVFCNLIVSLVQMRYCPEKYIQSVDHCACQESYDVNQCFRMLCEKEKLWCEKQFDSLTKETYQPLVVRTLLSLQSCYKRGNPSSKWFVIVIGRMLSKCLLNETGVKNVLQGIVENLQTGSIPWKRYEMIAKIIARPSSLVSSKEEYFKKICPQVLELLKVECQHFLKTKNRSSHLLQVTIATVQELASSHQELTKKYLLDPLVKPLNSVVARETAAVQEEDLLSCSQSLHMLLSWKGGVKKFHSIFLKYIHPMFILFMLMQHETDHVTDTYSSHRKSLKDCMRSLLDDVDTKTFLALFHLFMFNEITCDEELSLHLVRYDATITIRNRNQQLVRINILETSTEERVAAILSILEDEKFSLVRGDLLVNLLSQLSKTGNLENKDEACQGETSSELLMIDASISRLKRNIELVSLISAMMDRFGPSILQDTSQIVKFIKSILEKKPEDVTEAKDDVMYGLDNLRESTINMSLMLILLLTSTQKLTSADYAILTTLVPALEIVVRCYKNTDCSMMADQLKQQILSRGVIQSDHSKPSDSREPINEEKAQYNLALKNSTDPLLPTRGHGLILLKQLLRRKNKYALENHDKLFDIFDKNISDDDSFLYLAAIDGMIALAGTQHQKVLPLLCQKFVDFHKTKYHQVSCDVRMKTCEAIIKICRECDEILPIYTETVMAALLAGVKDHESCIRASSLAAVGEVCKILKFSVEGVITEIFSCVCHILQSDNSVEVRRAAVQVFALLFTGLETKLLQILLDLVRDIHRVLKKVCHTETDDVTKYHADNALNILNDVIKDLLFEEKKLEKRIQILS